MDFGDVSHFANIDYQLRPAKFLFKATKQPGASCYFGCPVWAHKGLIGRIKNEDDTEKSDLQVYSQSFNSIELNSSYYGVPPRKQIYNWRGQVGEDFRFFPKAPKDLTFYADAQFPSVVFDRYIESLSDFGEHLGGSFLQFSPYISPQRKKYLFDLLEALPNDFSFFVELRQEEWFQDEVRLKRFCEYLAKREVGFVITDTPGRRDVLHMKITSPFLFVRFKGNNLHASDFERIDEWIQFVKSTQALENIAFFHHHSDEKCCIDSINYMRKKLKSIALNFVPEAKPASHKQMQFFDESSLN